MIDGFKIVITGKELRALCIEQARFHQERAEVWAKQLQQMVDSKIEIPAGYSNDPKSGARDKVSHHLDNAAEFEFIAEHLDNNETFLIARHELRDLGVHRRR